MEIPIYTKWTQYIRLKAPRKGSTGPNRWILSNRKKRQEEKRIDRKLNDPLQKGMEVLYHSKDAALRAGKKSFAFSAKGKYLRKKAKEEAERALAASRNPGWGWASFQKEKAKREAERQEALRRIEAGESLLNEEDMFSS